MNKRLTPKLRFPEFRDAGEWKEKKLRQIAKPVSDKASDKDNDNILTLSGEHGLVLQSDYFGKKIAGNNVERYIRIVHNDFVYNDRTTKLSTYGSIKRLSKYESGIVSPIYKCFRFGNEEIPVFWDWYFESGSHESQLHGLVNEGARAGRFNISIENFLSTSVWMPSPAEQQKIAECLTALDDLIAAQGEKVETLKAYKKGLLQNLFPAEGESTPRLRFPEFQSAGEWERKTLGDVCDMKAGEFIPASDIFENFEDGLYPCYGGNGLRGYTKKYTHSGKHPLIGRQGALCGNVNLGMGQFYATEHALVVTPKENIDTNWLFYNLGFLNLNQYATGQAQPGLSVTTLEKVKIIVPSNISEQQRIAELLSALDEEIRAEGESLAGLKVHKRGLMQGLFPRNEETSEVLKTSEV